MGAEVSIEFTKRIDQKLPIFAWLIQLVEGTDFSHIAVRIQVADGRSFVYHSTFVGVNFLATRIYEERYEVLESYKFKIDKQKQKELEEAIKQYKVIVRHDEGDQCKMMPYFEIFRQ
jgi:hypothetical protein